MAAPKNFYQRLSKIFRSGPSIERRVKGYDYKNFFGNQVIQNNYGYNSGSPGGFGRETSPFSSTGQYGILDRQARAAEFHEMENYPIIASALNITAEETVGGDDRGKSFHIFSKNTEIKRALEELFYDTLNLEFNLALWARNLIKFGDFFLYIEVVPDIGIIAGTPIPVTEVLREEGYDTEDPYAVRYKWVTRGNQYFENWQIAHFRLLGNDMYLPYGSSILDPARRTWRTLTMMEDAMLLYRIVRSSEKLVFFIDTGGMEANDIPSYMEGVKAALNTSSVIDSESGRMDGRYLPAAATENYYIPVRGSSDGTKIEQLAAGANTTAIEDIEFVQKKLFAALQIPKAYLTYDEDIGSKATLAQEDVRFSRRISFIQKTLIAELNKIAMIHLYARGFDGPDLANFELKLSNPSSIALQQRLELWASKFEIAEKAFETGLADREWVMRNILEFSTLDISSINDGIVRDKIREVEIDAIQAEEIVKRDIKTIDQFDPSNSYQMSGGDVERNKPIDQDQDINIGPSRETSSSILQRLHADREIEEENNFKIEYEAGQPVIKPSAFTRDKKNAKRRVGTRGRDNLANPDFKTMLNPRKDRSLKAVYTNIGESLGFTSGGDIDLDLDETVYNTVLTKEMSGILEKMDKSLGIQKIRAKSKILTEALENIDDDEEDELNNDDFELDIDLDDDETENEESENMEDVDISEFVED